MFDHFVGLTLKRLTIFETIFLEWLEFLEFPIHVQKYGQLRPEYQPILGYSFYFIWKPVAFYMETSCLLCITNPMIRYFIKCKTGLI